jgi:hypothetical protein
MTSGRPGLGRMARSRHAAGLSSGLALQHEIDFVIQMQVDETRPGVASILKRLRREKKKSMS